MKRKKLLQQTKLQDFHYFCTVNILCEMENSRIHIPNEKENESIGSSFNHLVKVVEETELTLGKVVWDFSDVTFLHPFFLAPLAIYKCQSVKEIACENISLPMQSYLNSIYFDRMLHFENAAKETAEMVIEQYASHTHIPLCSFSMTDANKDAFSSIARDLIVRQAKVGAGISTPISYFISELIDNIYGRFFHWNGTLILLRIPVSAPSNFNYIDYLE